MNATANDLSCFRIVEDERDGAFLLHAYSASCRQVVEISTHWTKEDANTALAHEMVGRKVRAIAGAHRDLFNVVGTVESVNEREAILDFNGKYISVPNEWFSYYFQSML